MPESAPPPLPRRSLPVTDCAANRPAVLRIDRLTPSYARRLIMRRWWVNIPATPARSSEEADQSWHWDQFVREANTEFHRSYVALSGRGGRLEAECAIIFRLDARSLLEPGRGAAYLQYVASAPRNRSRLVGTQAVYKGIGEALVTTAILESLSFGLEGRVFGEPLPDSVAFYEKMGFAPVPMDARPDRVYYEIPKEGARAQLAKWGVI